MWVPLFESILPKTLLKWATPQSKLATKFKTKNSNTNTTIVETTACIVKSTTVPPTLVTTTAAAAVTFPKQYCRLSQQRRSLFAFAALLSFLSSPTSSFTSSSSSSSLSSSRSSSFAIVSIAQLLLRTVADQLSFLMNDIRTKSLYRSTASSSSSSTSTAASSLSQIDSKLFNNNYKNNHRTYNNSSKSNKVFLHYTPRDPRLRNQESQASFNKHFLVPTIAFVDRSELKRIEDLCNYGELIGGPSESPNSSSSSKRLLNNFEINEIDRSNFCQVVCESSDCDQLIVSDKSGVATSEAVDLKSKTDCEFNDLEKNLLSYFEVFRIGSITLTASFRAGIVL